MSDQKFSSAAIQFSMTVPKNYNHDTQIDTFTEKTKNLKTIYKYSNTLTSENFSNATNRFVPGMTYGVKMFPIVSAVTTQDCAMFLEEQNAILMGAHGLTLAEELMCKKFHWHKSVVSFDKREALPQLPSGKTGVPIVHHRLGNNRKFGVIDFDSEWPAPKKIGTFGPYGIYLEFYLLCFYNKSRKARNRKHA